MTDTKQLTEEQAIEFYNSKEWVNMRDDEIVNLQLYQNRLCLPFDRFHQAVERILGRPVWTHEFASQDRLIAEYEKKIPAPTMEEIINLIPKEKRIVI